MSGGCEKKIIYVGKSENLLSRLIEHFCAMDTLKKNIIKRVCEKAHENIYCYMNPYLWHEDVEVVLIVDVEKLEHELEGKILRVKDVVDYIEQELKSNPNDDLIKKLDNLKILEELKDKVEGYLETLGKLDNLETLEKLKAELYDALKKLKEILEEELKKTKPNKNLKNKLKKLEELKDKLNKYQGDLKTLKGILIDLTGILIDLTLETLEDILIDLTQPHLNKKNNKKDETLKDLKQKFKSYLCDYGLSIEELVKKKKKLKSVGGCYIIKHSILPEELTCCIKSMLFRENNSELFRKFCCNK